MAQARARAQTVLRRRGAALGLAVLPAAVAVVLWAGRLTGRMGAPGAPDEGAWGWARWAVTGVGILFLIGTGLFALLVRRVPPPPPLSVPVAEREGPELYRLVRELAERMDVPAPGRIALAPDCDSWLENDAAADGAPPTLVIGSPFLWWMRVDELRALLAPVLAGTAATADPEIRTARRFVRGLDALALGRDSSSPPVPALLAGVEWVLSCPARKLLRVSRRPAAMLERSVAAWAAERAQQVDYGLRIAAQEQVGLAYAGWDRLLSRVALPAWRIGRHPDRLDAGVVSALTELSRRDRLADGYETRLGERPACDLLEDPGAVDQAVSSLAAQLFYGTAPGPDAPGWTPVAWADYPSQVVERIWRGQTAALHLALDRLGDTDAEELGRLAQLAQLAPHLALLGEGDDATGPTIARTLDHLRTGDGERLARLLPPAPDPNGPPRTGRELLAEHVAALICCAAIDAGAAEPGLDWLDGPVLLVGDTRRSDLTLAVSQAVEHADDAPLRAWLAEVGIRLETPVRLS